MRIRGMTREIVRSDCFDRVKSQRLRIYLQYRRSVKEIIVVGWYCDDVCYYGRLGHSLLELHYSLFMLMDGTTQILKMGFRRSVIVYSQVLIYYRTQWCVLIF
jgi:hypothetical protein